MDDLKKMLIERKEELEALIAQLESSLACAPKGILRISPKRGKTMYYLRTDRKDYNGKYIKRDQIHKAAAIAQRDYENETLERAMAELRDICTLLATWEKGRAEDTFDRLAIQRKELVIPATMTDEEYAIIWKEAKFKTKGFRSGDPEIYSAGGQRVRSKSEAILMDNFDHFGVPRRFESPVRLWDGRIIYPDFTLLNKRLRREFIWEHFGKADDPAYMRTNMERLNDLILSGYIPGYNLIITFETNGMPLNQKVVQTYIKHYLL